MNSELSTKFKKLFESERRRLIYSHGFVNEDFHIQKDDLLDDADLTTSELEHSMRIRLRNREALFLKKLDEALSRIQGGTFGDCESCNDPIDIRRLEARPTTTLCINCKETQERIEQLHIDGHRYKSLGKKLRLA